MKKMEDLMIKKDDDPANRNRNEKEKSDKIVTVSQKEGAGIREDNVRTASVSTEQPENSATGKESVSSPDEYLVRKIIMDSAKTKMGLFPVKMSHVKYFLPVGHNRDLNTEENEAGREAAAMEFLTQELKYRNKVDIMSSRMSPTSDILWITVARKDTIKRIYGQAAKTKC